VRIWRRGGQSSKPGAKSTDFPAAAATIRGMAKPGDVVYVPQISMFWGMTWYLVGPTGVLR